MKRITAILSVLSLEFCSCTFAAQQTKPWKERLHETIQAYPVLKEMKILCVKRAWPVGNKPSGKKNLTASKKIQNINNKKLNTSKKKLNTGILKKLGFPTNHECYSALEREIYNNEIGILEPATGRYTTLYKPEGRHFVGHINLHWNGKKFLFTQSDETNWKIFEMNVDGTGLRQVSHTPDDVDCFEPCYLPDGRIIVNSTAPYQCVPCWHGASQKFVGNLYIMNADGSNMRRLTFDQDHDFHPSVRHNGQVVYARWDYTGINRLFLRPIMSMNPDGTSQKAIYGSNSWFPNGLYYPKELPGRNGRFLCVLAGYHGSCRSGTLAVIDINQGSQEDRGIVRQISGTGEPLKVQYKDQLTVDVWPQFITPTPITDRIFLVSAWKHPAHRFIGIYVADMNDNVKLLYAKKGFAFLEPTPLIKREMPPALPDRVDLSRTDASAYIQDVYFGPGLKGVPRGTIKRIRVIAYDFGYIGLVGCHAHHWHFTGGKRRVGLFQSTCEHADCIPGSGC